MIEFDDVVEVLRLFFKSKTQNVVNPLSDVEVKGFTVFKSGDRYRWIGVYSNSFRDDDGVPEILSSESHKLYVESVDAGQFDYPDLYIWHEEVWKIGEADFVGYDEVEDGIVFSIAGGYFDVGKEFVAEALLKSGIDWRMSHAMPHGYIERDNDDPTIYAKYSSVEVTVLPSEYAANPLTGFGVLEDAMIPAEKRAEMEEKLGANSGELLNRLEVMNKNTADAEKGTREFKEATSETEVTEEVDSTEATETPVEEVETPLVEVVEEEATPASGDDQGLQALIEGIGDAAKSVATDVEDVKSVLGEFVNALETLGEKQAEIVTRLSAMEKQREDDVKSQTPTVSQLYGQRIQTIIGQKSAEVKEGEEPQGPEETEVKEGGNPLYGSFVSDLIAKSNTTA